MRDAFIKKLFELAKDDPKIFLITGDLGFGVLEEFEKNYPKQFLNAGVAEQNMTGLAAGLALEGRTVFTYSIANFPILRCLEQIRNDVCYHNANVKIVSIGGGFSYGALGFSHHATEDIAILRSMPTMTVLCPADLWEVEQATAALVKDKGPAYLRLDKSKAESTNRSDEVFQIGKARILRDGNDLTLVGTGGIVGVLLEAAKELSCQGVQVRVLSMHTIKPLDREPLFSAAMETGGVITVEEHTVLGGLGAATAEAFLEEGVIPQIFYRIGLRDCFSTLVGSQNYLREKYGMDVQSIVKKSLELLSNADSATLKKIALE